MPIQSKLQTRKSIFEVFELVALCRQTSQGEGKQRTFFSVTSPAKQGAQLSPPNTGGWAWAYSQPLTTHITHNTQHTHSSHVLAREVPSCVRTAAAAASRQSLSSLAPAHAPRLQAPCCGTRSSLTKRSEAPRNGLSISGRSQGDLSPRRSQLEIVARAQQLSPARSARRARPGRRAGRRGPGWR